MTWVEKTFAALSTAELYEILELRQRVFILEQTCVYRDLDGLDDRCDHLWSRGPDGAIAAYLRILPPGLAYPAAPSLGRVIASPASRGTGLGRALMLEGITRARAKYGAVPICISAQTYLERFYSSLGFRRVSEDHDLDGIAHCEMIVDP